MGQPSASERGINSVQPSIDVVKLIHDITVAESVLHSSAIKTQLDKQITCFNTIRYHQDESKLQRLMWACPSSERSRRSRDIAPEV